MDSLYKQKTELDDYIKINKKIITYELNNLEETSIRNNIKYKFKNDAADAADADDADDAYDKILHFNISHLDLENNYIINSEKYSGKISKYLKTNYMDKSIHINPNPNPNSEPKYKIISETCKMYLKVV